MSITLFCKILESIVIKWTSDTMCMCNIISCLSKVSPNHLKINMPHQLLQAKYINPCTLHVDSKCSSEGM
jgi:hypothetical protein